MKLAPLFGKSAKPFLSGKQTKVRDTEEDPLFFEMVENRAVIKGRWKALMLQPPFVSEPIWQLFDLSADPLEKTGEADRRRMVGQGIEEDLRGVETFAVRGEQLFRGGIRDHDAGVPGAAVRADVRALPRPRARR